MKLSDIPVGGRGIIRSVGGEEALRCRLLDMGLTPGTQVAVTKTAPMGDPLELRLRGYTLSIRRGDAARIQVEGFE